MADASLAELLAWGGVPVPSGRARFVVIDALDDFPGQASAAALLAEGEDDVFDGADLLARAAGAAGAFVAMPPGSVARTGRGRTVAPLEVPRLHPLGQPRLLARWLAAQPRFDGASPEDFLVLPVFAAAAAGAARRGRPALATWVTVTGRVRAPVTLRVPLGTPVATLVRLAGGTPAATVPYRVRSGVLRRATASEGVVGGDGAVVLLPAAHPVSRNDDAALDVLLRRADSVCVRCGLCDAACPVPDTRPSGILATLRAPGAVRVALPDGAGACTSCRVCETACPLGLGVGRIAGAVAAPLRAAGFGEVPGRALRLMPRDAMRFRLGLDADPAERRDAVHEVPRVRFAIDGDGIRWRAVHRAGERVWAGEVLATGEQGARILAPIAGRVTVSRGTLTLRREAA